MVQLPFSTAVRQSLLNPDIQIPQRGLLGARQSHPASSLARALLEILNVLNEYINDL